MRWHIEFEAAKSDLQLVANFFNVATRKFKFGRSIYSWWPKCFNANAFDKAWKPAKILMELKIKESQDFWPAKKKKLYSSLLVQHYFGLG